MPAPSSFADDIRHVLREHVDAQRAAGQQAYMKSALPFLGVRVPQVRQLTRETTRTLTDPDDIRATALELWRQATHREERYAAQELMAKRPVRGLIDMLDVHEEMVRTGAWWDHVDEAASRIGEILAAHPQELSVILRLWADDPDMWIRRVAIIAQRGRKNTVDLSLLTDVIEPNIGDNEFFIRKAIGWALRDLSRDEPDWVRQFVAEHPELSPLSQREALKHLT